MDVTMEHLNIPRSPSVLRSIQCILTDACVSSDKRHFFIQYVCLTFALLRQYLPSSFLLRSMTTDAYLCPEFEHFDTIDL